MTVLDIAKKTGQKPSTVFYLVKTLTDMGVV
jgi:DNA-binding IclR family transcriptional regulator